MDCDNLKIRYSIKHKDNQFIEFDGVKLSGVKSISVKIDAVGITDVNIEMYAKDLDCLIEGGPFKSDINKIDLVSKEIKKFNKEEN